jgi:hypothetical protein
MTDKGLITMLVHVPRWTEQEMVAVAGAARVWTWREADLRRVDGPTDVSLNVRAETTAEARQQVRAALGDLDLEAFLASTA